MPTNFFNIDRLTNDFRKGITRDSYDEPTYLTFSLDFDLDKPLINSSNFLNSSPLFNRDQESNQSAINYLQNRGFPDKANNLAIFLNLLRHLRDNAPWYFQSISGLDDMWKRGTDTDGGGFKANDLVLTIDTLEAVDLRITELADLYRNTIYDKEFMREIVPDNLRWFSMDIWVAEWRNLRNTLPPLLSISSDVNVGLGTLGGVMNSVQTIGQALGVDSGVTGSILQNFGYVKFKCRQCEFDFSNSFGGGSSLSVGDGGGTMAKNGFAIKIGWFEEENKYASGTETIDNFKRATTTKSNWSKNSSLGDSLNSIGQALDNTGSFLSGLPVVGNKASSLMGKAASQVQSVLNTPNKLITQAASELQQIVEMGNLGEVSNFGYLSNDDKVPPSTATPKGTGKSL
jgi:hypothetical protein